MIHALEISFILLNKKNKFIIIAPIKCATKNLKESIIYTTLNISTCKIKSLYTNINEI